jgi:hypothetical protein
MASQNLAVQPSHSDICRASELRWRGAAPGIPPRLADEFMARLKAGRTVRELTSGIKKFGPALVTYGRFKKHCELHPDWEAEARPLIKVSARAANLPKALTFEIKRTASMATRLPNTRA